MSEALIRRHEPVLRFAKGENFFPMTVDEYVQHCSLHAVEEDQGVMYIPDPFVDTEDLVDFYSAQHYLVYADRREEDRDKAEALRKWIERQKTVRGPDFRLFKKELKDKAALVGVKLAQVFKPFHLDKEIFEKALQNYGAVSDHVPAYHYRVMQDGNYNVVQYWFFYAYNDFATSHGGINDHEGDWESVHLYFRGEEPVWATYSSHVGHGRDLGRPWNQVERDGDHPVVYVGAGSHANYLTRGEYPPDKAFVAGDVIVGGSEGTRWGEPQTLDRPWFTAFMGRWGARQWDKFTHKLGDAAGGPPTGPKYNRDGSVRSQWDRPVAYAGLDY